MDKVYLPDNHKIFSNSQEISEIFAPIKAKFELCSFVYIRTYADSSCFLLTDYSELIQHHLKSGYSVPAPVYIPEEKEQIYNYIPLEIENGFSQARYDHTNMFHIGESMDIIHKQEKYTEIFTVNVPLDAVDDPSIVYLNNKLHFDNFFQEFKLSASHILREVEEAKFILPGEMNGLQAHVPQIKRKTKCDRLFPDIRELAYDHITKRELEALVHLFLGKSVKMIARDMGDISPRTVDDYVNSLKTKLGCFTKVELLSKVWNSNFPYQYIRHHQFGDIDPILS